MITSQTDLKEPLVTAVQVTDDAFSVELSDGRSLTIPLAWYPRLLHSTPAEREHWRLIGRGRGIQWPDIEEDISLASLLAGRPSAESAQSLGKWLQARKK